MRNFKAIQLKDVDSLITAMHTEGQDAVVLAGGTNVSNYIKQGRLTKGTLLDITRLNGLKGIKEIQGMLEIGAATTIAEILDSESAADKVPFFTRSLKKFANPLIRNLATIGGNIADASPVADTAPLLLVTDAVLIARSRNGLREIPINDFFDQPRKTKLQAGEVLTHIRIPFQQEAVGVFLKMGERNSSAISVISVAAYVKRTGLKIDSIRIAAGGVAPKPLRAEKTERLFTGQNVTSSDIERISKTVMEEISPISDVRGSANWRRKITANLTARAVRICLGMEE
jgi:CO/xanthine dehydrogenase FAD-binding subunit